MRFEAERAPGDATGRLPKQKSAYQVWQPAGPVIAASPLRTWFVSRVGSKERMHQAVVSQLNVVSLTHADADALTGPRDARQLAIRKMN
jgi:hypothetical protein